MVLVDEALLPLWEKIAPKTSVRHTIVMGAERDAGCQRPATRR